MRKYVHYVKTLEECSHMLYLGKRDYKSKEQYIHSRSCTGTYQQYSSYFVAVVWTHLRRALLAPPWNERRGLRLTGGLLVSVLLELSTDELLLDWGCRAGRWLVNSSIWTRWGGNFENVTIFSYSMILFNFELLIGFEMYPLLFFLYFFLPGNIRWWSISAPAQ